MQLGERLGQVNRGASRRTIDMHTLPHKYRKVIQVQFFMAIFLTVLPQHVPAMKFIEWKQFVYRFPFILKKS